jgi:hypothetical protein
LAAGRRNLTVELAGGGGATFAQERGAQLPGQVGTGAGYQEEQQQGEGKAQGRLRFRGPEQVAQMGLDGFSGGHLLRPWSVTVCWKHTK